MKNMQKKLTILLILLIIVLISLISFGGIYYKSKNNQINLLPNYKLGTDIKGYRRVTFVPSDENSSEDENNTVSSENETSNTTTENNETDVNEATNTTSDSSSDNMSNEEKYEKAEKVFSNRLKALKVDDYTVAVDKSTGKVDLTVPDNDNTDMILADITQKGVFQIVDSDTNEVLLDNSDVRSVDVEKDDSYGTTRAVMKINFNNNGTKKFKDVTAKYQNVISSNTTSETNSVNESSEENTTENETSEDTTNSENENAANETNTTDESQNYVDKKVTLKIDDSEIMSTDFQEIVDNGTLALTLGTGTDTVTIDNLISSGKNVAAMIENEPLPVNYTSDENMFVSSTITTNKIKTIIYIQIIVACIISLVMIIKYRKNGLFLSITSVGFIGLVLIIIRLCNVELSVDGLFAFLAGYMLNLCFEILCAESLKQKGLSKKELSKNYKEVIKRFALVCIPMLIISVVFILNSDLSIFSFGMVMFYSTIISFLYNLLLSKFYYDKLN